MSKESSLTEYVNDPGLKLVTIEVAHAVQEYENIKFRIEGLIARQMRIARADRNDYGDVQANRIEAFAEELQSILCDRDEIVPEVISGTREAMAKISLHREATP